MPVQPVAEVLPEVAERWAPVVEEPVELPIQTAAPLEVGPGVLFEVQQEFQLQYLELAELLLQER